MKDIFEVIRKKQAQQAKLRQQIEALQAAAKELEAVQHLLNEESEPLASAHGA